MRHLLLLWTAFLAIATAHRAATAAPIVFDFTYTGSLVNFVVPTTGTYQILAFGAQGADVNQPTSFPPTEFVRRYALLYRVSSFGLPGGRLSLGAGGRSAPALRRRGLP